jgi:hypothetical protein
MRPPAISSTPDPPAARRAVRLRDFLRRHPVLCLIVLAPMVEYLTGSSALSLLIGNPILFLVLLGQNLAFYGSGVLLVREARVRWRKGWATVLLLGASYGILEEGIATGVLFNPGTTAGLGSYGHLFGVNWATVAVLVPIVHPLYSISLPILLFELALPEYRSKSLVSQRGLSLAMVLLGFDALATAYTVTVHVSHFFAGYLLLGGCGVAAAALVLASRLASPTLLSTRAVRPTASPASFGVLAAAFPWVIFLGSDILIRVSAPPVLVIVFVLAVGAAALRWVLRHVGRTGNAAEKTALGIGLVAGLIPMGIASQIGTGPGLVAVGGGVLLAVLFCAYLWRRYRSANAAPGSSPADPVTA